eukprot:TRINITY_DN18_c0_g1_i1.p1 TRINITY_DN18_c0_g1~~TRINITY_DN18_c0_g1_i1.p1  ORF type:complete len:50 (+),score=8.79 TRINITY_DN18_c0_g1_i1:301-450(+)
MLANTRGKSGENKRPKGLQASCLNTQEGLFPWSHYAIAPVTLFAPRTLR